MPGQPGQSVSTVVACGSEVESEKRTKKRNKEKHGEAFIGFTFRLVFGKAVKRRR